MLQSEQTGTRGKSHRTIHVMRWARVSFLAMKVECGVGGGRVAFVETGAPGLCRSFYRVVRNSVDTLPPLRGDYSKKLVEDSSAV